MKKGPLMKRSLRLLEANYLQHAIQWPELKAVKVAPPSSPPGSARCASKT